MIASVTPRDQKVFLDALTHDELRALPYLFEFWAMEHQLPPLGDWRTWVILGGRGAGKTRAGAEWVRAMVEGPRPKAAGRAHRVGLIGETFDQGREVMVFGESGIMACSPPDRRPDWIAGRKCLVWQNGATAHLLSAHDPEALRGWQFDAIWADEIGCAAIDKGTNQPNVFLDTKSSESALPFWSNGRRDDLIQAQYLRAVLSYWADSANNPVSDITGAPMVDLSRAHVWAWDARPYPEFPALTEVWSDGENYGRGHWLNGRVTARSLSGVVAELCARSGVTGVDVSSLYGLVRGYRISDVDSARAALQPLMLAHGFDAAERNGTLTFTTRGVVDTVEIEAGQLVQDKADVPAFEVTRAPSAELMGRVRVLFHDADRDYEARAAEAAWPDETTYSVTQDDLPMVLTEPEGHGMALRWLAEARAARDTIRFALAPSRVDLGPGDVVRIAGTQNSYRIERIEDAGPRQIEAVRISGSAFGADVESIDLAPRRASGGSGPVEGLFLDLPLIAGDEVPYAPYFAASADNWPSAVALYTSGADYDYAFSQTVQRPAIIGQTLTALKQASAGLVDRGGDLLVRLVTGTLESLPAQLVRTGRNIAAIGGGTGGDWEVFSFEDAELVAPDVYAIRRRYRGVAGTDGIMPPVWPAGSLFVMLDDRIGQVPISPAQRGVERHYRYGPAALGVDNASYRHLVHVSSGAGLRPYRVAHLGQDRIAGDDRLTWIRRARVEGDAWTSGEVPLGEDRESYRVRIYVNGDLSRETYVEVPEFIYDAAMRTADGATASYDVAVSQMSAAYGAGPEARLAVAL